MLSHAEFAPWHWWLFSVGIVGMLALDLRVLHRKPGAETLREAVKWTVLWSSLALSFAILAGRVWGKEEALEFGTGYVVELSLSMDNVFVMVLIFSSFGIAAECQHRVVFFGILGAMLLRGLMIWLGVELVQRISWMMEIFGGFLLFSGLKIVFLDHTEARPEQNPLIKLARRILPLSSDFDGQNFMTYAAGRRLLTPLALALIAIEVSDLVFALDSIPAIFGVTQKPFLIFTSNVFAILGLRSLYFVLAGAIVFFRYLKPALAVVLSFVGMKMLVAKWLAVPTWVSLGVVTGVFLLAIAASVAASGFGLRAKTPFAPRSPPECKNCSRTPSSSRPV